MKAMLSCSNEDFISRGSAESARGFTAVRTLTDLSMSVASGKATACIDWECAIFTSSRWIEGSVFCALITTQ